MRFSALDYLAFVLVIVGALNWGLVGVFNFDLVQALFGLLQPLPSVVYSLVGLSGIFLAIRLVTRQSASAREAV